MENNLNTQRILSLIKATNLKFYLKGLKFYSALQALNLCINTHNGLRKDGITPEYDHPISVASFFTTFPIINNDSFNDLENLFITALLHDIVEDHPDKVSLTFIFNKFGISIQDKIWRLTKKDNNTEVYYKELVKNPECCLIKGSDRINNLETIFCFPKEKIIKYIDETKTYVIPLIRQAQYDYFKYFTIFEQMLHILEMQLKFLEQYVKV